MGAAVKTAPRRALLWLALLVGGLGWTAGSMLLERGRIPAEQDYLRAAEVIRAQRAPGDAIVVAPHWAMGAMKVLGDLAPTFDPLLTQRPPEQERVWILAEPEGRQAIDELARSYRVVSRERFGRIEVACLQLGRAPTFHAVEALQTAEVSLDSGASSEACDRWTRDRWECPGYADWQRVSAEWLDVDLAPRKVLWAHPPKAGQKLVLRFPEVLFEAELEVVAGHTIHGAQFGKAPVTVELWSAGVELGKVERSPRYPCKSDVLDTRALQGQRRELVLKIWTPDNGANHFVVDVIVRK